MASMLIDTQAAENRLNPLAVSERASSPATVPLLHFGLRQLFLFVALICALLAAIGSTNGITPLILLLASAIVAMHVFATALGSRLRLQTDEEQLRKAVDSIGEESTMSDSERAAKLAAIRSAPRSPWHARGRTYLPWLPRLVVGTMVLGGLAGAWLLNATIGHHTSPAGIAVGAFSFAILGGWLSFLCGNFYGVFRQGFREALAQEKKDRNRYAN